MIAAKAKSFASALSTEKDWRSAVRAAAAQVRGGLSGACDLAVVFVTELYPGLEPGAIGTEVRSELPCRQLIGCNSSGVISGEREVEMEPGIAILGMTLPDVRLTPFCLPPAEIAAAEPTRLLQSLDIYPTDRPKFLIFADPMTCDIERLVHVFNGAYPGSPVIGGLASGLAIGRPNWLMLGHDAVAQGAVGMALSGAVELEIVVAQGCRPIGAPLIVTKAEGHVLYELGGKPPLEVLREVIRALSPEDQELARQSLFAGLVMNEYRDEFERGDFLIRNLMGYDAETGALMIGANVHVGQTLQFQLRDAKTSDQDLRDHLAGLDREAASARGALLISCCGRGRGLYGKPHHDSQLVQAMRGPLPLAGFFANGEIGPVAHVNYIHGYTSSLAFIR